MSGPRCIDIPPWWATMTPQDRLRFYAATYSLDGGAGIVRMVDTLRDAADELDLLEGRKPLARVP